MSYIFSLVAKSDMQNKFCVRLRLAVTVILNKSITRRKANITADRQYHSSLDEYHKSVHGFI